MFYILHQSCKYITFIKCSIGQDCVGLNSVIFPNNPYCLRSSEGLRICTGHSRDRSLECLNLGQISQLPSLHTDWKSGTCMIFKSARH